ncbi:MAG: hypothetical protein AAGI38_06075 [Bacteroidota bacterium]
MNPPEPSYRDQLTALGISLVAESGIYGFSGADVLLADADVSLEEVSGLLSELENWEEEVFGKFDLLIAQLTAGVPGGIEPSTTDGPSSEGEIASPQKSSFPQTTFHSEKKEGFTGDNHPSSVIKRVRQEWGITEGYLNTRRKQTEKQEGETILKANSFVKPQDSSSFDSYPSDEKLEKAPIPAPSFAAKTLAFENEKVDLSEKTDSQGIEKRLPESLNSEKELFPDIQIGASLTGNPTTFQQVKGLQAFADFISEQTSSQKTSTGFQTLSRLETETLSRLGEKDLSDKQTLTGFQPPPRLESEPLSRLEQQALPSIQPDDSKHTFLTSENSQSSSSLPDPELDLDEVWDEFTKRIEAEYRRFYGS